MWYEYVQKLVRKVPDCQKHSERLGFRYTLLYLYYYYCTN
jgi:hypothetical protein